MKFLQSAFLSTIYAIKRPRAKAPRAMITIHIILLLFDHFFGLSINGSPILATN